MPGATASELQAEIERLEKENATLKRRPQGTQREGLKAGEVLQIVKILKQLIDDGEDADVAYNLACRGDQNRPIVGVTPDTFKVWKPDIFKLMRGEATPANSMLSGADDPAAHKEATLRAQGRLPQNAAMAKLASQLGDELATKKKEAEDAGAEIKRLREENDKLKTAPGKKKGEDAEAEIKKLREENAKLKAAALGGEPEDPPTPTK